MDPTARVKQVFFGYIPTQCVWTAVKLGVPDALEAGPQSIGVLGEKLGAEPGPLGRMLDVLVRLGLFTRDAEGRYAHNDASQCLRTHHENSMADLIDFCGVESYRTLRQLEAAVRSPEGAFAGGFANAWGVPFWQHLRERSERGRTFGRAMERQSEQLLQALTRQVDFSAYDHIVDVGGGKGQLFRPITAAGVEFRGTVFDLPETAPLAHGFLSDEGLDHCRFVGGDFFEAVPGDGDLYVLKFVLHDWDDAQSVEILRSVREAMKPGAKVMIIELIRGGGPSPWSLLSDMIMLTTFGAKERTEGEFRALLTQAGFAVTAVDNIAGAHFGIMAEPA